MDHSKHILRFISIIFALIFLTVLMITINYDFFLDVDHRKNADLVLVSGSNTIQKFNKKRNKRIQNTV